MESFTKLLNINIQIVFFNVCVISHFVVIFNSSNAILPNLFLLQCVFHTLITSFVRFCERQKGVGSCANAGHWSTIGVSFWTSMFILEKYIFIDSNAESMSLCFHADYIYGVFHLSWEVRIPRNVNWTTL